MQRHHLLLLHDGCNGRLQLRILLQKCLSCPQNVKCIQFGNMNTKPQSVEAIFTESTGTTKNHCIHEKFWLQRNIRIYHFPIFSLNTNPVLFLEI